MGQLVCGKISRFHGEGQRFGLLEGLGKTVAGDGVHAARSIPNQRRLSGHHTAKATRCGYASAFQTGRFRISEAPLQVGEFLQSLIYAKMRIIGKNRHSNFVPANRSNVNLAAEAPVDFDKIRPWIHRVVAAETEAETRMTRRLKPNAAANRGRYRPRT